MKPTKKQLQEQKVLSKVFVYSDLLIQEIDELKNSNPTQASKDILTKALELQTILEPLIEHHYKDKEVSKSTFFLTIQDKINYIFKKEYV